MPETETRPEGHRIPARHKLDRYQDDAGVTRADSGTPPRAVGPTHHTGDDRPIAERDGYYLDGAGIRRIVRAGDRIPVGFTPDEDNGGEPAVATAPGEPDSLGLKPSTSGYSDSTKAELEAEVERRNADREDEAQIEVKGSGADGNVVKDDLVAALEADDEAQGNDA